MSDKSQNEGQKPSRQMRLPEYAAFADAATRGNLLAMSAVIPFDHETAVSLADRFVDEPYFFLLESAVSGPGQVARYSFMGFEPLALWHPTTGDALDSLEFFLSRFRLEVVAGPSRATTAEGKSGPTIGAGQGIERMGGAVGWLGYDLARTFEPTVGLPPPKQIGLPDAFMFVPKIFMALDQLTRSLTAVVYMEVTTDTELPSLYQQACDDLRQVMARALVDHDLKPVDIADAPLDFDRFAATFAKDKFLSSVAHCLEEIRAGEIFQIQIGNRLTIDTPARAFDIFRHLRMLNPSPYMFFYKMNEDIIMGASPEMMVGVTGARVVHRPIAGTRRRTWSEVDDRRMKAELVESEKERAEHVMLVDLARNDIGRIAQPGSVKVEELMSVEEYSHVFHMVSQVTGERRVDMSACDVMRASFPNGTVTGAPKIRAMQLINKLEPCSREFYAGSLGIFGFDGNLKSTLLIRSMHYKNGRVATQASAGIVFDSIPEQEWLETRNKMAACLTAMQNTL